MRYSTSRNEELYIFNNGTYKQIYKDKGIAIESPLNNWWLEELSDGGIYLHLEGAKYYFYGPSRTDKYKTICPAGDSTCEQVMNQISNEAYDWIGNNWIDVSDQLILNVRMESNGNVILMHLWDSGDQGFPIIGGESEIYRKKGEMDK